MSEEVLATIWKSTMKDMKAGFAPTLQEVIRKKCSLRSISDGVAEIAVDNKLTESLIRKYAVKSLTERFTTLSGTTVRDLKFIVVDAPVEESPKKSVGHKPELFVTRAGVMEADGKATSNLNPKYTFSQFIVGKRNRVAHAAAIAVGETPGTVYNPLYLYGGVGLGKTHLMQAIGNHILENDPRKRVLYVSSETFVNEFVSSIRGGSGKDDFKKRYRNVDVLLIDDIQFIAGKDGTQEEFFHTFNALHQSNRQIIITSDQPPVALKDLEERLSSRFSMGMVANMQLPEAETRQAILMSKAQERGITLQKEALEYIANEIDTNIRELEGALSRVILEMHSAGKSNPSMADVKESIRGLAGDHQLKKKSAFQEWLDQICEFYDLKPDDISGPRRQQELVKPRQILMYIMKYELGMTYPAIGREVGGRDHTTAMHSVDKIEKELKHSPELFNEMQQLKEYFYAHRA